MLSWHGGPLGSGATSAAARWRKDGWRGMATVQPLSFGDLLLRYRSAAGLTQEALAERAHLSARAISDLERGVKHTPRHDTVQLLADALQLSAAERATFTAAARRHCARSRARDVGPHLTSAVAQPPFV